MKNLIPSIAIVAALLGAGVHAGIQEDLDQAKACRQKLDEPCALAAYQAVLALDSTHLEALWMASYLATTIGARKGAENPVLLEQGRVLADRAAKFWPDKAEARFVQSLSLGLRLKFMSTHEKMVASREMRERIRQTLGLDPNHPGAWYLLGRWRLTYATLGVMDRTAVKLFLGGIPAEATLPQAEEALRKAIQLRPIEPLYFLDLGRALAAEGREKEAREVLRKAEALPPHSTDDLRNLAGIHKLLASLGG